MSYSRDSISGANGIQVSGSPIAPSGAISLSLTAITPTTVNGVTISGSSTPTLAVTGTSTISGSNTGDQTITLTGDVTGSGTGSFATTIKTNISLAGSPTTTTQSSSDNSTKIATTAYVTTGISNAIAGVNPATAVQAATTAAANTSGLTYNNGVSGVGATFTGSNNTALTFDGFTFTAVGQRALVKNDTQSPSGAFNGVYYVTQIQTSILPPILTRALDYDMPSDINNTGAIPVVNGTVNALTSWLLTSSVTTVGTDPLTYSQFSYSPTSIIPPNLGGTGIANNASSTLTISGSFGTTLTVSGTTSLTLPTSGTVTAQGNSVTGSGNIVLATSPTLTGPALGTPTALVGTNITGTGASFTAGVATVANSLKSASTTVSVSAATAPTSNQTLTATSTTGATWQTHTARAVIPFGTGTTTNTSYDDDGFARVVLDPSGFPNIKDIFFQSTLQNTASGSFAIFARLVTDGGSAITGGELTATLGQFGESIQVTSDISAAIITNSATAAVYRVQYKVAAGGNGGAVTNSLIIDYSP